MIDLIFHIIPPPFGQYLFPSFLLSSLSGLARPPAIPTWNPPQKILRAACPANHLVSGFPISKGRCATPKLCAKAQSPKAMPFPGYWDMGYHPALPVSGGTGTFLLYRPCLKADGLYHHPHFRQRSHTGGFHVFLSIRTRDRCHLIALPLSNGFHRWDSNPRTSIQTIGFSVLGRTPFTAPAAYRTAAQRHRQAQMPGL